jgi:hypothetical protein
LATCLLGSYIFDHSHTSKYILTNDAQEFTAYRFEFRLDVNRIRKDFIDPEFLTWMSRTKNGRIYLLSHAAAYVFLKEDLKDKIC